MHNIWFSCSQQGSNDLWKQVSHLFVPMAPSQHFILALPMCWGWVWNRNRKKWQCCEAFSQPPSNQSNSKTKLFKCKMIILQSTSYINIIQPRMPWMNIINAATLKEKTHTHTKPSTHPKRMCFCMHSRMNTEWSNVCSWQKGKET